MFLRLLVFSRMYVRFEGKRFIGEMASEIWLYVRLASLSLIRPRSPTALLQQRDLVREFVIWYCSIDIMIDMHAIGIARRDGIDRALAILVIVLVVILIVACKVG